MPDTITIREISQFIHNLEGLTKVPATLDHIREGIAGLKLVAEQALERGINGEEFTLTSRYDLNEAIKYADSALRAVESVKEELKNARQIGPAPMVRIVGDN